MLQIMACRLNKKAQSSELVAFLMVFYMCFHYRKAKSFVVDPTVFICISMIAKAVGPTIVGEVKQLLEPMLAVGLR